MLKDLNPSSARQKRSVFITGFTIVELICVIVIVSLLAAIAVPRMMSASVLTLQSARDQVLLSLSYAQQKALSSPYVVQLVTSSNTIDIRQDKNADGFFSDAEHVRIGGVLSPITLSSNTTLSSHIFHYSALGKTQPAEIQLSQLKGERSESKRSVTISVSESGFAR